MNKSIIYYFEQELKHITWIIVAMKMASVMPAMANKGAEKGARESK
jgi:hypothetical protein